MFDRVLGSVEVDACQRVRRQVLELVQSDDSPPPADTRAPALTRREREVLTCVGRAYDNREIAEELGITVRTVNRHLENIRGKLGCRRRSELVRKARQVDPEWSQRPEPARDRSAVGDTGLPTWPITDLVRSARAR
ncbi:hypothetical protein ALI144C_07310 [Actinosynnema sp. ALI-1.44]|uniref:response regulator transcription factor n=1 Tax=Actinosynnema sp. ALI-1.44 TaxID=1933779 RepID=UPI00097C9022|nr:helix-turn-helix transcriptional regulator [Actinosynnema sp. ALI-1.44]ONI88247.1 hypothetical protein ALI144C_07310 [Actinosynnema sp. ALI-1.44]